MLAEEFLLTRRQPEGHWLPDKWHTSWIYTTFEAIVALCRVGYDEAVYKALNDLIAAQRPDGSWGARGRPSVLDTAYALLALATSRRNSIMPDSCEAAVSAGLDWLVAHSSGRREILWMGKELYAPYRVDEIYVLAALTATLQERQPA